MITNLFWLPNCGFPQLLRVNFIGVTGDGAILVDSVGTPIGEDITASVSFTYDYDLASRPSVTHYAVYSGGELVVSFHEEDLIDYEDAEEGLRELLESLPREGSS